jgi:PAS domain S-box-containing protein
MSQALPDFMRNQKLLVVDDNPASLYATSRILRSAGFEVLEAATGTDALAFATQDIALIVLDINLPDIDGLEVCRLLRARTYAAYLPIVHLSATFVTTADMAQGLTAGADSYLTHPADPAVLIATVRTLLYARQSDAIRRAADSRFRAVFQLASSGIALLDAQFRVLDANPTFCALAGRNRAAIVGEPLASVLAAEHHGVLTQVEVALARDGHWEGDLPIQQTGGGVADIEWRIAAESADGSRIAIATDVTERRRAETERDNLLAGERAARGEAERLNRMKDEFLATLSHELRNPLNAIVGWVHVLQRTAGVIPEVKRGLEVIERNSRLQSHLIADLLDYAGMRFGKMHLEKTVIDPVAAIQSALTVVTPLAQSKSVHLGADLAAGTHLVMGDDARIQQIVWNLVNNAIKFTPPGGQVTVSTGIVGGQYEIAVSDTGRGISPEFLPYIFDRFSQQEAGSSKTFSGLGIGLTIVKHLVEAHGGTISANSAGEGLGARFTVRLPLTQEVLRTMPRTTVPLSGMKILVVEDDADTRAFIARVLGAAGATVAEASSGDQALALLKTENPDMLVSDIGMAKWDGYQLIRNIRASGLDQVRLPAIALTAFSRDQDRTDALNAGFQAHLVKPIEPDQLINSIAGFRRGTTPAQS